MNALEATQVVTLLTTTTSKEEASRIARVLVSERLAACANIIPGISSVYRWNEEVQEEKETLLVIKTTVAQVDALEARVVELHSYDVPELLAIPVVGGHQPYITWVDSAVEV